MFQALEFGNDAEMERPLSPDLENLITAMTQEEEGDL